MSTETISPIKCRAAVLYQEGQPLVLEEVRVDVPREDQVRIRMVAAGVCATDGHLVWGEQKVTEYGCHSVPLVLGHEGAGVVESVGHNVSQLKPGDQVLTTFMPQCKTCGACNNPMTNLCFKDNVTTLGAVSNKSLAQDGRPLCSLFGLGIFSEYALLKQSQVIKISPKASLDKACIISCAVATGFYAATQQAKVAPGSTCAIWGVGGIGLNVVKGCKFNGASHIIGIGTSWDKRDLAIKYGASDYINVKELKKPLEEHLRDKYPNGVDYAFDCFGSQAIIDQALKTLSPFGTFVMVGVAKAGTNIVYPTANLMTGRRILGGYLGLKKSDEAFTELVNLYTSGKYDLDSMITNQFSLDQINEAFKTLKDRKGLRSIITFQAP